MKDKTVLGLAAMANVTILEAFALSQGLDGAILAGVVATLAGLGGYELARRTR